MTARTPAPLPTDDEIRALLPDHPAGPGCAIGILRGGELVKTFFHGNANVEHGAPIGPETVFRIASVTKQFLCAGLLALADAGKLDLDAPLRDWLPDMHPVPGAVTLRQAMSNTSGIRDHLELWYMAGGGLQVPHRLRDSLALSMRQTETNFPPGTRYLYSNANFLLLSRIAELASGQPLEAYLQARFFAPLGMTRTHLRSGHHDVIPGLASGYVVKPGGRLERGRMTTELWGEGSAQSCLTDLVRWLQYYRTDPERLIARMREPVRFANGQPGFYGLGLFLDTWRGERRVGHYGLWPGYLTEIVWYDRPDISLVCLSNCNAIEPAALNKALAHRLIPDLAPPPARTDLAPGLWDAALAQGPWFDPQTFDMAEFAQDEAGQPQLLYYGGPSPLTPVAPDRLAPDYGRGEYDGVRLTDARDGRIHLRLATGDEVALVPVAHVRAVGTVEDLVGDWISDEVGGRLIVSRTDRGYAVETPGFRGHDWITTPLGPDMLKIEEQTGPWPRLFYLRAAARAGDTVTDLVLSGPRVRRMRYRRVAPGA